MRMRPFTALGVALLLVSVGLAADDPKPKEKVTPEKAMAEAIVRWNKVAEGVTSTGPIGKIGFTWDADYFPHPTFKGGSKEAYGAFAGILAKFLAEKGNYEFLTENNLFSTPLRYLQGGKPAKLDWTLGKLTSDLSQATAYGDHDEATRKILNGYAEKIAERAKKEKGKP